MLIKSNMPKVSVCAIALNEEEYIEYALKGIYSWCHEIIIIEGAVELYPRDRVTKNGSSTDKTIEIINNFPDSQNKIIFVQNNGFWKDKMHQRSEYLKRVTGTHVLVLDVDEFYTLNDLDYLLYEMESNPHIQLFEFQRARKYNPDERGIIHFWYGFDKHVIGGYWDVPHNRIYKMISGMKYIDNHNHPTYPNGMRTDRLAKNLRMTTAVRCYHTGFTKKLENIVDKNQFYVNRGEGKEEELKIRKMRQMYVDCRKAWESWSPGDILPHGATIHTYLDEVPKILESHPYYKEGFER